MPAQREDEETQLESVEREEFEVDTGSVNKVIMIGELYRN